MEHFKFGAAWLRGKLGGSTADDADPLPALIKRRGPAGDLDGPSNPTDVLDQHPKIWKFRAETSSRVEDFESDGHSRPWNRTAWPRAGGVKVDRQYKEDGIVRLRWLVRAKSLFGSKHQTHASPLFEVELPGSQEPHSFKLLLVPTSKDFGVSHGWGKVQVRSLKALPPHLSDLSVRILAGRGNRDWRGPEVASFKKEKAVFELPGEVWDFKSVQDDDESQHLAIVVELSLTSR